MKFIDKIRNIAKAVSEDANGYEAEAKKAYEKMQAKIEEASRQGKWSLKMPFRALQCREYVIAQLRREGFKCYNKTTENGLDMDFIIEW